MSDRPEQSGFRFRSDPAFDIDAYRLAEGRHALFAHVKDERFTGAEHVATWVAWFEAPVVVVGRALKTPARSLPLPPVWSEGSDPSLELWAVEAGLELRLEVEGVLNPGLFLDQRENRRRLTELLRAGGPGAPSAEHGVLNLFSYTGAFTLAALAGGATRVTSVDVSARYLSWEGENVARNFPERVASCRRLKADARDFLRRARARGDRYRAIVLDPPTFSRGQGRPLRIREDLVPLVQDALACLPVQGPGALLVSANDAGWDRDAFLATVRDAAHGVSARVEPGALPPDFPPDHPLVSAWILR